ncbi:MAG: MmgE/PrpD family protein, partial [Burkholderiaceae bacterium]
MPTLQPHTTDFPIETRVAEHLAAVAWADLPAPSRENAVRAILWWLATGLEGVTETHHATLLRYVEEQAGPAEASILGSAKRTTAELAGLVNGRAGKAWEHEDKYWVDETIGFAVGCCVVPAAIAAAESRGTVSGTALATAVALAIDLEIRLLRPLGLGFVPGHAIANATFTLGTYGAAAAAAKIFCLGTEGFLDALGIAHCQASGNFQGQVEGRGVALQAGIAVRNGIAAARMAAIGMPGPRGSLTGRCGLYAMHYPLCSVEFEEITDRLGEDFLNIHLGFKGYPCGVVAHPAIDAVLAMRASLNGRSIRAIDVFGATSLAIMASPIERKRTPASVIEAQFSIPWAAACAIR